jgi:hypothetical protein
LKYEKRSASWVAEKIGMHDEKTTLLNDYRATIYMTEDPGSADSGWEYSGSTSVGS